MGIKARIVTIKATSVMVFLDGDESGNNLSGKKRLRAGYTITTTDMI